MLFVVVHSQNVQSLSVPGRDFRVLDYEPMPLEMGYNCLLWDVFSAH